MCISPPPPYTPPQGAIEILYEDEEIIAVNKPSGLLSVPGKGIEKADCLIARLLAMRSEIWLVHRLDCDTSGVIIFAKTRMAQRHLGLQFERRHVHKTYLAWVEGTPQEEKGEVDLPLILDWENRPRQKVDFEQGRKALTYWQQLRQKNGHALLEMKPHTGRSHQLRVHAQSIGHPILGDPLYGPYPPLAARLLLHAATLDLHHPTGGNRIEITAPLPSDFHF